MMKQCKMTLSCFLPAFVAAMVTLSAGGATAQTIYQQLAIRAGGPYGSVWFTDLELQNSGDASALVQVDLLLENQDNSSPATAVTTVDVGSSVRVVDPLQALFGLSFGFGALRITPIAGSVLVSGRVYNDGGGVGTYGLIMPGRQAGDAVQVFDAAYLLELAHNFFVTRTTFGILNTSGNATLVAIDVFAPDSSYLGGGTVTLQPYEMAQVPWGDLVVVHADAAYAVVQTATEGGEFLAYATVVSDGSGDAWTVLGQVMEGDPEPLYVPYAAHFDKGGFMWTSNLEILGMELSNSFTIDLLPSDSDNTNPVSLSFDLPLQSSIRLTDVLSSFAFSGTAALRVTPTSGSILASSSSRVDDSSGFVAHRVPLCAASRALTHGQVGSLMQLTQSADFLTNIGLVNTTAEPISVVIDVYSAYGAWRATHTVDLAPLSHHELANPFREDFMEGFALVRTETPSGAFCAYARVLDKRTFDAIHLAAQPYGRVFHDLSVQLAGDGLGAVRSTPGDIDCGESCSQGFLGGTEVVLSAVAEPGSLFAGWLGDCAGTGSGDCILPIDQDLLAIARFNVEAASGDANGDGEHDAGDLAEVLQALGGAYIPPGNGDCTVDGIDPGDLPCILEIIYASP